MKIILPTIRVSKEATKNAQKAPQDTSRLKRLGCPKGTGQGSVGGRAGAAQASAEAEAEAEAQE